MRAKDLFFVLFVLVMGSCADLQTTEVSNERPEPDKDIRYATRFAIARGPDATWLYLLGNRNNSDTTAIYVLTRDSVKPERTDGKTHFLNVPCRSVAALSSIYTQVFYELGALDLLTAIDNIDYVTNAAVLEHVLTKKLPELARTPEIDVERTMQLRPDIVFTYGMGDGSGPDSRLASAGIPVAVSVDHLEGSPLARAEWIKFFAEFVDKRNVADSLFALVELRYKRAHEKTLSVQQKPAVLCEIRYSDAWYMPGGRSYIATLLRDAGAKYLWEDDSHAGSLPLSFEEVFARARDADFWIHLSMVRSKKELLSFEPRYAHFRPFKTGNLYNNTKKVNEKGYSDYWASGMLHPERILSDLITIFHPALAQDSALYYYEKIR